MSLYQKGLKKEKELSRVFHKNSEGTPILVSPLFLRDKNCGQLDLVRLNKIKTIEVMEVKSSRWVSKQQQLRIRRSCQLLGHILKRPISLYFALCQK